MRWRWIVGWLLLVVAVASGRIARDRGGAVDEDSARDRCDLRFVGHLVSDESSRQGSEESQRVAGLLGEVAAREHGLCVFLGGGEPFRIRLAMLDESNAQARAFAADRLIELDRRLVLTSSDSALVPVLAHEIAHLALADAVRHRAIEPWYLEGAAHTYAGTVSCEDSVAFALNVHLGSSTSGRDAKVSRRALRLLGNLDRAATTSAFGFVRRYFGQGGIEEFHALIRARGFFVAVEATTGNPYGDFLRTWADSTAAQTREVARSHRCAALTESISTAAP